MEHLKRKRRVCCGREKERSLLLHSQRVHIPSYSFLADAQSKFDEAAEQTYCKLRASDKLLASEKKTTYWRQNTLIFLHNQHWYASTLI